MARRMASLTHSSGVLGPEKISTLQSGSAARRALKVVAARRQPANLDAISYSLLSKFLTRSEEHSFDCENRCLFKKCLSSPPLVCTIAKPKTQTNRDFLRASFSALATK